MKYRLVNIAVRNRLLLKRWTKEVSVMLEKSLGNTNIQKLRVILLLEVDFNMLYKIVFNSRIMLVLENTSVIPYKIIGERRTQSAIHLVLNKKLQADIANIWKRSIVTICVDMMNYYDRVIYLFINLFVQYFRLEDLC